MIAHTSKCMYTLRVLLLWLHSLFFRVPVCQHTTLDLKLVSHAYWSMMTPVSVLVFKSYPQHESVSPPTHSSCALGKPYLVFFHRLLQLTMLMSLVVSLFALPTFPTLYFSGTWADQSCLSQQDGCRYIPLPYWHGQWWHSSYQVTCTTLHGSFPHWLLVFLPLGFFSNSEVLMHPCQVFSVLLFYLDGSTNSSCAIHDWSHCCHQSAPFFGYICPSTQLLSVWLAINYSTMIWLWCPAASHKWICPQSILLQLSTTSLDN